MPFKTGSWGPQAQARARRRNKYFYTYNKERDPLKKIARKIVENSLNRKEIQKGKCRVCKSSKTSAHHEDYSKPLKIIWLCLKHHREADKKLALKLIS